MAKKENGLSGSGGVSAPSVVSTQEPVVEPAREVAAPPMAVQPKISFDLWFKCSDRSAAAMNQPHHKAGMMSFTETKGKRTKQEWDRLFAGY